MGDMDDFECDDFDSTLLLSLHGGRATIKFATLISMMLSK